MALPRVHDEVFEAMALKYGEARLVDQLLVLSALGASFTVAALCAIFWAALLIVVIFLVACCADTVSLFVLPLSEVFLQTFHAVGGWFHTPAVFWTERLRDIENCQ